jgi:hypothetical protein
MSIMDAPDEFKQAVCEIQAKINGNKSSFQVDEDLSVSYDEIEFELDQFPQVYLMWAMIYSEVREQVNILEKKIRRRRGTLTVEILGDQNNKGLRRGDIADIIECDDDLMKIEAEHIRLQKVAGKLYHTLEALKMKNDNIRSLSGFKKQEMRS